MDAACKFAVHGPNMESALPLLENGHSLLATLFINIITEKFQLINKHLHSTSDCFTITASVTNTKAPIKFHNITLVNSEIKTSNFNKLP